MKQFVTLFVVALLSGCVVPGVDQTPQMSQDSQVVEQAYVLCKRAVDSTPAAVRLSEAFVLGKNKSDRYLEKTANVSYATDEQISDLKSYQVDLKICRDKAIDDLQALDMEYATLVADYFTQDDQITADVVNKKITIGEANRTVTKSEYSFSLKQYDIKKRQTHMHQN